MRSSPRPFRSRFARLLALLLIAVSLVGNGVAGAQALAAPVSKACCADMVGQGKHSKHCEPGGKPCPAPNDRCDDQCLMRCQVNNALPSLAMALPVISLRQPALPVPTLADLPTDDPGPELRPPITG
jgi:hypothetical protein